MGDLYECKSNVVNRRLNNVPSLLECSARWGTLANGSIYKARKQEHRAEAWCHNQGSKNIPGEFLTASSVKFVTDQSSDGSRKRISKLAREHAKTSSATRQADDVDKVPAEICEPHAVS